MMLRFVVPLVGFSLGAFMAAKADAPRPASPLALPADASTGAVEVDSASQAVSLGNRLLRAGRPGDALEAYARAEALQPGAPEVAFGQGLAHYALKDYSQARESFQRAATADYARLANDALYSLGTTFHAEALDEMDAQPRPSEVSLAGIEDAMRRYQQVLASQPEHDAARDALFKAAVVRRRIRELLQEVQPQSSSSQSQEEPESKEEQPPKQDSGDHQEEQEPSPEDSQAAQSQKDEEKRESSESQQRENTEDSNDSSESSESSEESETQPDAATSEAAEQEAQPQESSSSAENKTDSVDREEQASREQAQRQLREMMQSLRQRSKLRPQRTQPLRLAPVEKDW